VYITLVNHHNTLEITTNLSATWKIPASNQYGHAAVLLDMSRLGTPTSATLAIVYSNTALVGTNQIGITLSASPQPAGTVVTPLASSVVTMANLTTYPQTIEQELDVSELGTTKQWVQLSMNLALLSSGPTVNSATLILYYNDP
jgi:hypothetical protein